MSLLGKQVNKILKEIQNGNNESFGKLFDLTYNHLKVVAYNYLANPAYLDDAVNETYLNIFKYMNSVDLSQDGYNWMCKIVQNVAYDINKQFQIFVPINKIQNHEFFYEMDEIISEKNQLLKVMDTFDAADQELLYLRFWEDKTYAEISRQKGKLLITVYRRIQNLLKEIKKMMKIEKNDGERR